MNLETKSVAAQGWDSAYEYKIIILLTLGFGLVGLDRWILPPLFAAGMGRDLHLGASDLGDAVGALGIAWGISAIFMGSLADRIGQKRVLVPAIVIFSILSIFTGFAGSLAALLVIRAIMGISEGAVAPTSVAVAVDVSYPARRGLNNGMFQCAFALFGLALAPILATQLLKVMSWHYILMLVGLPGLAVAVLIAFTMKKPASRAALAPDAVKAPWRDIFRHRNVGLGMVGLLCAMTGIFVISAMMPSYLTGPESFLKLSPQAMGFVTSAIGFGGFLGQLGMPGVSDLFGRKSMVCLSFALSAVFLFLFIRAGAGNPALLFGLLFCVSLFNFGALALIGGPIAAESAPLGMMSSVAGLIIGSGEIFGGGVAPVIAGGLAHSYGIQYTLYLALGGQLLGIIVSLFFRETAPRFALGNAVPLA